MTDKQKKIKEAYSEYWGTVKDYVDENGYCNKRDLFMSKNIKCENIDLNFTHHTDFTMRPKSLQGIENNNGWIKIESETDLPKESIRCYFVFENRILEGNFSGVIFKWATGFSGWKNVTHYQPITKPNLPIY